MELDWLYFLPVLQCKSAWHPFVCFFVSTTSGAVVSAGSQASLMSVLRPFVPCSSASWVQPHEHTVTETEPIRPSSAQPNPYGPGALLRNLSVFSIILMYCKGGCPRPTSINCRTLISFNVKGRLNIVIVQVATMSLVLFSQTVLPGPT